MILKKRYTIKGEVFYLGLLSSLLILLVFGFLMFTSLFKISIDNAKQSIKETNMQISVFTEGYFTEVTNTLKALSNNLDIRSAMGGDEQIKQKALATYLDFDTTNKNIAYIYSGYENGLLLINDYTPPAGYDPTSRPWYVAAMGKRPKISIGLPYQEANTNEWLISQSKVLLDLKGKPVGVIALDVSLESIIELLHERHMFKSQRSYVIDREGKIIIHPDEQMIGGIVPEEVNNIIPDRQGELTYTIDNTKKWAYFNTIDSTDWVLITDVKRSEVLNPVITRLLLYSFSIVLLSAVLGTLQSKIFGKRFAEPLTELGKRISDITAGRSIDDTTYRYSNHEIAKIANNIEQLAEHSLNKKANELKTIIESTQEGILVVNDKQEVIYINSRFQEMWNISQEVLDSRVDKILTHAIVDQLVDPTGFLEKVQKINVSDKEAMDTIHFKDGRVFECFSCPLIDNAQIVGRVWSFRDITERKQSEQKIYEYTRELEYKGMELERIYQQLNKEIDKARYIHERTLPKTLPKIQGISFSAHYQPAKRMGGDFYDVIQTPDRLVIYLSDVSGHGLDGAMLSIFVKETIDSYVSLRPDELQPQKILQHLDSQFRRKNYPDDYFVCIFLSVFDLNTKVLTSAGAGFQVFPLVRLGSGSHTILLSDGLPVSAAFPPELMIFQEKQLKLEPGSTILFSTDGLFEQKMNEEMYLQRAQTVFYTNSHLSPPQIVRAIKDDFLKFSGGSQQEDDDITFLVMQLDPPR